MYEVILELGYSPGLQAPDDPDFPSTSETESSSIDSALAIASQDNKLVLLDFYAEWCIACKALEELVFADASVIEALENYVFVTVDTDEFPDAAKSHNVVGMPTLVVLDSDGVELYRNVGLISPEEFSQVLSDLVSK